MMFDMIPKPFWPRRWLQLAVFSLALSGIFSIILVVSRTPQLIALFPWMGDLFSVSLVIHVDLSVLVWFLSMTGLLWSLLIQQAHMNPLPFAQMASWGCVLAATLCMALSPLTGEWEVIKSNYIPVITNGLFFTGLALLLSGMLIGMLQTALAVPLEENRPIGWGIYLSLPIMLVALACFVASAEGIPDIITGHAFYENLFWAGGHVLQFIYMQSLLVAWLVLARALGYDWPPNVMLLVCFIIGPIAAIWSFVPYLIFPVISQEHMDFFTLKMNVALGVGGILLALWFSWQIVTGKSQASGMKSALITSLILFIVGGLFGTAINGPNVRIPAHYHGSIVAVTLGLMGLAYYLLPKLGGRDVSHWRGARWQPWLYAVGQLMHITGLAVSGGYGVLRKAVGDTGDGGWEVKAALGMMGGGGLLAIIGGLLFVIIMVKGFRRCDVKANVE